MCHIIQNFYIITVNGNSFTLFLHCELAKAQVSQRPSY